MVDPLKQDAINDLTRLLAGGEASPPPSSPAVPSSPSSILASLPLLLESLEGPPPAPAPRAEASLDLLADVSVNVTVELGRTKAPVQDILKLAPGCVVPLDSLTGDPIDVYVNDRLVARGEVLVVNENFAVRITEVLPPSKSGVK